MNIGDTVDYFVEKDDGKIKIKHQGVVVAVDDKDANHYWVSVAALGTVVEMPAEE